MRLGPEAVQDGSVRRSWAPSHGHTKLTSTYGIITAKKEPTTSWTAPPQLPLWDKRATSRWAGEAEMWSRQKPHSRHSDTQEGRTSWVWCYSMRSMGFGSHIGHSNLWDLQWRDRPPKYLALETNGAYVQGTQGLWGSQILLLRDSRVISLILTPSIKATVRELPGLHVKVYLLILKHLLGGQGWVRTFLGMEVPGECHFCILPIPCLCRQRHGHSLTRAAGLLCS